MGTGLLCGGLMSVENIENTESKEIVESENNEDLNTSSEEVSESNMKNNE